jgi:hypothetical protein
MGKRDALVSAYMEALPAKPVLIHAGPGGQPVKVGLAIEDGLERFDALWFAKPSHAELVLMNCRDDFVSLGAVDPGGWIDLSARTVRDHVVNVASGLGASWQSEAEMRVSTSIVVEEIIARVEAMRQSGGLAKVNAAYKVYRQGQVARGEKAIPYSAHLASFTVSLVVLAAKNAKLV